MLKKLENIAVSSFWLKFSSVSSFFSSSIIFLAFSPLACHLANGSMVLLLLLAKIRLVSLLFIFSKSLLRLIICFVNFSNAPEILLNIMAEFTIPCVRCAKKSTLLKLFSVLCTSLAVPLKFLRSLFAFLAPSVLLSTFISTFILLSSIFLSLNRKIC